MGTHKIEAAQAPAKTAGPAVEPVKPAPEQVHAPVRAQRTASPLPPPNGAPPPARAGDMLRAPQDYPQAPRRAQMTGAIQRQLGNHRTVRLLDGVQAKIAVGPAGDQYEQEADQAASRVVAGQKVDRISRIAAGGGSTRASQVARETESAKPASQRAAGGNGQIQERTDGHLQAKAGPDDGATVDDAGVEARISSPSGGQPLPEGLRAEMESGMSADFSPVRVHDSAEDRGLAENLGARAFTHNNHIWLGPGAAQSDRSLMAHELTHVLQQDGVVRRQMVPPSGDSLSGVLHQAVPGLADREVSAGEKDDGADEAAYSRTELDAAAADGAVEDGEAPAVSVEHLDTAGDASADEGAAPDAGGGESPGGATPLVAVDGYMPAAAGEAPQNGGAGNEGGNGSIGGTGGGSSADTGAESADSPDLGAGAGKDSGVTHGQSLDVGEPAAIPADSMHVDRTAGVTEPGGPDREPEKPAPIDDLGVVAATMPVIQRTSFGDRVSGLFSSIGSAVRSVGSSLAEGISSSINGLISGLRSGWDSLSSFGRGLATSLSQRFGGLLQGLGELASGLMSAIGGAWNRLRQLAGDLVRGVTRRLSAVLAPVLGAARRMVLAVARVDGQALTSAWQGLTDSLGSVYSWINGVVQAVSQRISGLWTSLTQRFSAFASRVSSRASALFSQLGSAVRGARSRLSSLWGSVRGQASRLSGYVGGLASRLQSLLGGIVSRGRSLWNSIQQGWNSLSSRVGGVITGLRERVSSAWAGVRRRLSAFRNRIAGYWQRLRQWAWRQLQRLIDGVRSVWSRLRGFAGRVMELVRKLVAASTIYRLARQLAQGLREFLSPIAAQITDKVYAAMPGAAQSYIEEQLARVGPVAAGGGQTGAGPAVQRTPLLVQRQPRSTASLADIGTGITTALIAMWNSLTWSAFFDMVLNVLLEQLFPVIAIYRQIRDFFVIDMYNLFTSFYWPRNLFTDPLGFLRDLWSNIYHFVVDIVMSVLRRLINILMSFMLWITIILTIIGAVGGSVAVGILGGILSGLATFGIGAGAGAAGGAAAGGAAGAGIGFGVAMLVNEAIFLAFLAVHSVTIFTLLLDLLSTRQTQAEKNRDYLQLAESAVAVGVGLALMFLAWLAGVVAKGVAALLRRLNVRLPTVPPGLSRFGRGAGSVQKPRPGAPSPEAVAAALAAEQRLAGQVGGALARQLVSKLGPELAEALVANLGAGVASRLTAEQVERLATLTAEQVLRLSRLGEAGFTRIINLPEAQFGRFAVLGEAQLRAFAGMEASAFERFAALDATQFAKFQAMSAEALGRFAGLSDAAFARFAALDAASLNKFVNVPGAALERFGVMDAAGFNMFAATEQATIERLAGLSDAAFNRFAGLDAAQFAKFEGLSAAALERYGTLADPVFNRFAGLDAVAIEKFAGLSADQLTRLSALTDAQLAVWASVQDTTLALVGTRDAATLGALADAVGAAGLDRLATMSSGFVDQFAQLDAAAMQRFMALPQNELAKFENLPASHLEHLANLPAGELEARAAGMTQAQLEVATHREVLGTDPAIGGRFRPNEADTALRVEASRGIVLDRYHPAPGQKGDWFDVATGAVYDGCSPPPSAYFDRQFPLAGGGPYELSLIDHVNHPTVDYVVIDTTGLGLTPAQEVKLQTVIDRVAGVGSPKIIRIP